MNLVMNTCDAVTSAAADASTADEPPSPGAESAPRVEIALHHVPGSTDAHEDSTLSDADVAWLIARLHDALPHLGVRFTRIDVPFLGDAAMARLHDQHCNVNETTDVLTFPMAAASEAGGEIEVDIAVCVDVAAREASARSHPLREELLLYVIHGLLHCAGHDDHDPGQFAAMHAREDAILRAIGVGTRFDAPGTDVDRAVRND